MPYSLRGRRALITGASRGLGEQIARTFHACGAELLLAARNRDALARLVTDLAGGSAVHALGVDLADPAAPYRLLAHAHDLWDRLDVLVNNAAILGPVGPAWGNDAAHWRKCLQVNLLAPVELCRGAAAWMAAARRGKM